MARILVALIAAGLVAVPCRGDDAGANPETLIRLEIDPRRRRARPCTTCSCPS